MKKDSNILKIPVNRILALVLMDVMSVIATSFAALYMRFDFRFKEIPVEYMVRFERIIPFNVVVTILFFVAWKLYKSVWRYASATELLNIVFATTSAALGQIIISAVMGESMPRSYYALYWFLLFGCTCMIRFSYRILRILNNKRKERSEERVNVMLIGAGAAANAILKEIESSQHLNLRPKCIIDDQTSCHGKFLRGIPIVGGRDKIMDVVQEYCIDEIIFAIPSASVQTKKELLDICKETGCEMRTLPGMYQLINGDVSVSKLKKVEIEDLLGR